MSRSYTFGKSGTSNAQYFDKYLKPIRLNDQPVHFAAEDVAKLTKARTPPYTYCSCMPWAGVLLICSVGSRSTIGGYRLLWMRPCHVRGRTGRLRRCPAGRTCA